MASDRRMRYLLGNLLAYHRREEKPAWWTFFDRCENVDELLEFDKEAIGGLSALQRRCTARREAQLRLYVRVSRSAAIN